jgi:hypothetical protein
MKTLSQLNMLCAFEWEDMDLNYELAGTGKEALTLYFRIDPSIQFWYLVKHRDYFTCYSIIPAPI